ncbi:hypothetical protein E2C01_018826 [Portunus trituberculatus]|uniref:Uncharacterized protein n=1 Tax=Portunus trituberculatus TaxID=210409 RepID=A0A5B7DXM0_PORTR|nr:hypothetical protein [Portunus trituberculatus]
MSARHRKREIQEALTPSVPCRVSIFILLTIW